MFEDDPIQAQDGGLAIAVLAEVKGLRYAWEKFGSHHPQVSWKSLVMPAAQLAKKWVIDRQVAVYLQKIKTQLLSGKFPALSALYLDSNGQIKKAGDVVRQPALSYTLSMIAEHGASYIYEDLAEILSQEIQSAGGIVTADDIRSYNIRVLPALTTDVMGHTYLGVGGSSSGGAVVAGILKFMTSFGEQLVSQGSLYNHRLAEAYKHAFAIRLSLGDPQYINTTEPIDSLLSDDYMQNLFFNGDDSSVLPIEYYGGKFNMLYASQEDHGTSHISVLDKDNNAVSLTTTVNTYFGSKVVSPTTGILFNDEMDDFSIPNSANYFGLAPAPSNYPEPFKRPLSSMSPSIVLDRKGKVRLIGGASGGPRIITATAQVILNYLGKGMRLLDAVVAPRIHSQLLPPTVYIEDQPLLDGGRITATQEMALALSSRGHNLTYESGSMAVTQFIAIDPDTGAIEAVSDPRKDGSPAGY